MELQDISTAPKDGSTIRVAHVLDPYSQKPDALMQIRGFWNGSEWVCNAGFNCIDRMLRFSPTHWIPEPSTE